MMGYSIIPAFPGLDDVIISFLRLTGLPSKLLEVSERLVKLKYSPVSVAGLF